MKPEGAFFKPHITLSAQGNHTLSVRVQFSLLLKTLYVESLDAEPVRTVDTVPLSGNTTAMNQQMKEEMHMNNSERIIT